MVKSIYNYSSYRQYMFDHLSATGKRGQLTKAAARLGCQTSFLSRVIGEELHLTPDHAFKLARFLGLSGDEQTYFLKLVDFERAGDPDYQSFLKSQLAELKKRNSEIGPRTRREDKVFSGLSTKYFSGWVYGAIHFLTCIPEFQTVAPMAKRLSLAEAQVKDVLRDLERMGFVRRQGARWIYQAGEFHLERTSPLVILHHQNWRQKAILDAQNFERQNIHYTTILTLSRSDAERIHGLILDFITELNQIAAPSNPEDELIFTCDFFRT